jgi:hypothetical protein
LRIDRRLAFNRLVVTFGCLLTVASALALPTLLRTQRGLGDPEPIAQIPPDDPGRGLVYAGLVAAKRGAPCAGAYEVAGAPGCTSGPDEPPPGLDVKQTVAPVGPAIPTRPLAIRAAGVAPAESDLLADLTPAGVVPAVSPDAAPAAAAFTREAQGIACDDDDGRAGPRVQVLYAYEAGTTSRYDQYLASLRVWAAGADALIDGRDGTARDGTARDGAAGDDTASDSTARSAAGPRQLRFVTAGRCEIDVPEVEVRSGALSSFADTIEALITLGFGQSDRAYMVFADATIYCGISTVPRKEQESPGPAFGRIDSGCWHPQVAARQFARNLGATEGTDLSAGAEVSISVDLPDSPFLVGTGAEGTGGPSAPPAGTADPPSPPTPGGPDVSAMPVRIADVTATTARLSWEPQAPGTAYVVHLGDRPLGEVRMAAVRIVGLRPETAYEARVEIRRAGGSVSQSPAIDFKTAPAVLPAPGASLTLANALTSEAADVFGARTATGTPVVLARRHDGANQRWQLHSVGPGAYQFRSASSGTCLAWADDSATAGLAVVTQPCDPADVAQRWRLVPTAYGFQITTVDSRLVLGVGGTSYRGLRVLVLQTPSQRRYQSWTTT